jgi:deazaflavin-dependent oxidoreductase (nitroreductase family)
MGFTEWFQRKMNARTVGKIRRKGGNLMGMEVIVLHTAGRRSREPRETPVTWFADEEDTRVVVASGGRGSDPDWSLNLMAHPDRAATEMHGGPAVPVTPHRLEGGDRESAWRRITQDQPCYAKYARWSNASIRWSVSSRGDRFPAGLLVRYLRDLVARVGG